MALDNLAFARIISLIKEEIEGGKIGKIQQISQEEFCFLIRNHNQNYQLLISTHPNMAYINFVEKKPESLVVSNNFTLLLKKHLENGKIKKIEQQNDDRIVLFEIENMDDYYQHTTKKLYIELIGRAANLILTLENQMILDCLKKIPIQYNHLRPLLANVKYELPTKPAKSVLPSSIYNELEYRKITLEQLKEEVFCSSSIYIVSASQKSDFHFFPFSYLNGEVKKYPWNQGISLYFQSFLEKERRRQYNATIEKIVKNEIKKNEKKLLKLQQEIQNAGENQIYKLYGDLLLTYSQEISSHIDKICLTDENNINHCIDLNPQLDVYKNANLYYKKYRKSKTALAKIQEQIQLTQDSLDYFYSIQFHLENADILVANEIKEELALAGYIRQKEIKKKKTKEKVYRPLTFHYDNVIFQVGQNNLQNEDLTFKLSQKNDYFFHVKDGPGSHVILHSSQLSEKRIRYAATLAAFYSKQANSSSVAVHYTLVKNVKKIPGGKPGKVIIKDQKTIYIDPQDPSTL